jgi:putative transposase
MTRKRRQYSSEYKFKLALEAAKGPKTLAQLSSDTGIHPNQISQWKAQLLDSGANLFQRNPEQSLRELQQQEAELYEQIGRLKMELEWLKKKVS